MKVLGVFAHPDDEVVCGWPLMQSPDFEKGVVYASDNSQGYSDRAVNASKEACLKAGIDYLGACSLPAEFYRLPFRRADFVLNQAAKMITEHFSRAILVFCPDVIYTHNPVGEYGNGDHRLIWEISWMLGKPIWFSDFCQKNRCHYGYDEIPDILRRAFFVNIIRKYVRCDEDWYRKMVEIYRKFSAWSWNTDIPKCFASIYEIGL